jgi:chitinase
MKIDYSLICKLIKSTFYFALITLSVNLIYAQKKVVGYYPYWYNTIYPADKISYNNLTHINISFASPKVDGSIQIPDGVIYPALIANAHNAGVKVLISLGGAGDTTGFIIMSSDSLLRSVFIGNLLTIINNNGFDGVDFDWEFPANIKEKNQFTLLLKELRSAFNNTNSKLLISMAAGPSSYSGGYIDFEHIVQYLDWVNIMGYDFRGSWTDYTGHNAPLYQNPRDPQKQGSDDDGVNYLNVTRKIPKSKIVLGVPFYGKEFNASGLFAKQSGTVTDLIYNVNIVPLLNNPAWNYYWDNASEVPYLVDTAHSKFVTFDDTVSIRYKCDYVKNNSLEGIMIWALGYDYINNDSPLLKTIGKSFGFITSVEIENTIKAIPSDFKLFDNYPNPFNPSTVIRFMLPVGTHVKLLVFDVLGREVEVLADKFFNQGVHDVTFNAVNLGSGVYFYTLSTENFVQTKKMMLIK